MTVDPDEGRAGAAASDPMGEVTQTWWMDESWLMGTPDLGRVSEVAILFSDLYETAPRKPAWLSTDCFFSCSTHCQEPSDEGWRVWFDLGVD